MYRNTDSERRPAIHEPRQVPDEREDRRRNTKQPIPSRPTTTVIRYRQARRHNRNRPRGLHHRQQHIHRRQRTNRSRNNSTFSNRKHRRPMPTHRHKTSQTITQGHNSHRRKDKPQVQRQQKHFPHNALHRSACRPNRQQPLLQCPRQATKEQSTHTLPCQQYTTHIPGNTRDRSPEYSRPRRNRI